MRERQSYGEQARLFLWKWGCAVRIKAGAAERETAAAPDSDMERRREGGWARLMIERVLS